MSAERPSNRRRRGAIAYMAGNGVAANLLMFFIVAAGFAALGGLVQEVYPEFSLDRIQVSVSYPGATPEEVEESILRKIEQQIEAVDGVKDMTSAATEQLGSVTADLKLGTDVTRALNDIKVEVDRIRTFPAGAERPEVRELTTRQGVIRLALYGDVPERTLKELAYQVEDELSALPEVSYVETIGVRAYEISIEVPLRRLRALGLTLGDVSDIIRAASLNLPAGNIDTRQEEVRIRTIGQNYDQDDFEDIVILSGIDGTIVRLGDIAEVRDGFAEDGLITRYKGRPSAYVDVHRASDEQVLEIVGAVETHLAETIVPTLPEGVELEVWSNDAELLADRLGLLIKNALLGLALVLVALTLFLEIRLAMWVAVGISVSFVGTLALMWVLGVSINLISMFAFILAVGIVVDDAIIVGENIYLERGRGLSGLDAAVRGARRVRAPVVFAVLTTIIAFSPLLFVPGPMGRAMGSVPIVVISVLALSLVESLLILPNHLSHLPRAGREPSGSVARLFDGIRSAVDAGMRRFTEGPLERVLRFATGSPAVVISAGIGMIILSISSVAGGILKTELIDAVDADVATASLEMPEGTPREVTTAVAEDLEAAGHRALERLSAQDPTITEPLLIAVNMTVGAGTTRSSALGPLGVVPPGSNIAAVEFKLVTADHRPGVATSDFLQEWRQEIGELPEAQSLVFASAVFDVGLPIHAELSHADPQRLARIGDEVVNRLREYDGVFDVRTDRSQGVRELQLALKPEANTLGLNVDGLARQVRSAFFGNESLRIQRGREEVRVYVRLPEEERDDIADIERYLVRTSADTEVPLRSVADVSFGESSSSIRRKNGRRVLTVNGDVDPAIVTGGEITGVLEHSILPALADENPGLTYTFGGEQQQQLESTGALGGMFVLAMLVIYALLAIPFRSYLQPLVVMAAVPFGIIGATLAHLLMGLSVGMVSMFGVIGLSGIVVNDSLVMIDFINERVREGMPTRDAIIAGAKARFRPILLTSVTTFLGVAPMIFERDVQAQFLVPLAASLGFGIVFATGVLMLIVPALATVQAGFSSRRQTANG